jgi:hypothetical protein
MQNICSTSIIENLKKRKPALDPAGDIIPNIHALVNGLQHDFLSRPENPIHQVCREGLL